MHKMIITKTTPHFRTKLYRFEGRYYIWRCMRGCTSSDYRYMWHDGGYDTLAEAMEAFYAVTEEDD